MTSPGPLLRRSALYIPASNARALAKAAALDADAVIFDLEDAVAPDEKPAARDRLAELLAVPGQRPRTTVIRVNAVATPFLDADLALAARVRPDAVLLPKPDGPDDVRRFAEAAARHGLDASTGTAEPRGVGLWLMVETAAALVELDALIRAGLDAAPRLECLVVGTNDLAKETGVDPGDERRWLAPWLMHAVLHARRHGVAVLDGVWNDFRDVAGFEREAGQAAKMGFDGKSLIHPSQLAATNRAFAPGPAALAEARAIIEAFGRPEHAAAGVVALGGRMVERLHLAQAERLLERQALVEARGSGGAGPA